jgi:two-component sensor histidine kinase
MGLHELATNATKYGALLASTGLVSISWEITGGAEPRLLMTWLEEHGPAVTTPARRGFGTRLIERGLAQDLRGTARIVFNPDGIVCTINAPLADIIPSVLSMPLPRVDKTIGG